MKHQLRKQSSGLDELQELVELRIIADTCKNGMKTVMKGKSTVVAGQNIFSTGIDAYLAGTLH